MAVLIWLTVANAVLGNAFVGPTPEYGASSFLAVPWWAVTEGIAGVGADLIMLASIASLVVRFVRGTETVRQQVWFALPSGQTIVLLLSFPLMH